MAKSVEEQVENWAKKQLDDFGIKAYAKTEAINGEILDALTKWPSKTGGKGGNYPDIKVLVESKKGRKLPVMIEVKGTMGVLFKDDGAGAPFVKNVKPSGDPDYATICWECSSSTWSMISTQASLQKRFSSKMEGDLTRNLPCGLRLCLTKLKAIF